MLHSLKHSDLFVTHPLPKHFVQIQELCRKVYPFTAPWTIEQLESHRSYFPDGQLIVIDKKTKNVVGLAFSLIIFWEDYSPQDNWKDFTSGGYFHNHNPKKGKTLYGAEVMVDPEWQGKGVGKLLYAAREKIAHKYNVKRIRAGARLRGYSKYADRLTPEAYVKEVVEGKIFDPTLSFQLKRGFSVIDVAPNYLFNDPESLGYAAVIEWLNPKNTQQKDRQRQKQSIESVLKGERYRPEYLPRELRRLVRKTSLILGDTIKYHEGEDFFNKIETYRQNLKSLRTNNQQMKSMLMQLRNENKETQYKVAHAFALQLELVNACETAYRTWRLKQKNTSLTPKSKVDLNFVLTSHPTEARSPSSVIVINKIQTILSSIIHNDFSSSESELVTLIKVLWLSDLARKKTPTVRDEAEYIFSRVLSPEIFDYLLLEKPSYSLKLRTWVGGDKDGHQGVNQEIMRDCLNQSRTYFLQSMDDKLKNIIFDVQLIRCQPDIKKKEVNKLKKLSIDLKKLEIISQGDGTRVRFWTLKFHSFLRTTISFVREHHQCKQIQKTLEIFPALVVPIELREKSDIVSQGAKGQPTIISNMIQELNKISGALSLAVYARGLIISHCERKEDIEGGVKLVSELTKSKKLPVVPLFESKEALTQSAQILKAWLSERKNRDLVQNHWDNKLEVMLGYSDSSKQMGALASRYLISQSMRKIDKTITREGLRPVFFHGSGGSVARGGGSLKEQISWWSRAAINYPKITIQGEMIQRQFASKEILNTQCMHLTREALKRRIIKIKSQQSVAFESYVHKVEAHYREWVGNKPQLGSLLTYTPYKYLDRLKFGSRPVNREVNNKDVVNLNSLRAIPWILCWTQTRSLLPSWWGIGSAWESTSAEDKREIIKFYTENSFLSSYVKTLGFTLAKVNLDVWSLYFTKGDEKLMEPIRQEYEKSIKFIKDVTGQKNLVWYRPWLGESIKLRSATINILNMLQVIAIESDNEELLLESVVGIASGMLTTG